MQCREFTVVGVEKQGNIEKQADTFQIEDGGDLDETGGRAVSETVLILDLLEDCILKMGSVGIAGGSDVEWLRR